MQQPDMLMQQYKLTGLGHRFAGCTCFPVLLRKLHSTMFLRREERGEHTRRFWLQKANA